MIKYIQQNLCNNCGLCIECCPMDILRMKKDKNSVIIQYREECQTCYQCVAICPQKAIKVDPYRRVIPMPLG